MPDNKTVTLMRTRDQWAKCDPEAMCHMSQAAIFHALNDAKHDVLAMHDAMLAAAPTPAAQSAGQEAVAWRSSYVDPLTCARVYYVAQTETRARDLVAGRPYIEIEPLGVIAAPVNGGERELGQVIDERDQYHDAAEKLADAIAKHFGVEIGEHSNLNCPWQNALDHIAQATKRAADAQQVGGDEHANRYRVEKASGGFWPNAVRCGTGTRELFVGHKKQCERVAAELKTAFEDGRFVERTAALTSPAKVGGDPAEPRDDSDREYAKPIGYLPAHELGRLHSGHSANLRSAKFGPSALDGDVPVYLQSAKVGGDEREAFEAWARDEYDDENDFARRAVGNGDVLRRIGTDYVYSGPSDAWAGWQARAALSADGGEAGLYRWLRAKVYADRDRNGLAYFGLPLPEPVSNPMFGSVAQHFDEAIRAAIAANQARKGE